MMAKRVTQILATTVLFGCSWSQAQTVPPPGDASMQPGAKKSAPTFHAAGIQGNIAPSGYSGGAREEDELPAGERLSCDRQAELLHAALTQPGSFEANRRLGIFYLQHGNPGLSVKYLVAAKVDRSGDAAIAHYLATAYIEANNFVDAGSLAAQLIDANAADAGAHRIKGYVEAAGGHAEAARAEYRLSATLDSSANNLFSAGLAIMALGKFEDAERMYAEGTAAYPKSAKLWLGRGMAEVLQEDQAQAIDSLMQSAMFDPAESLAPTLLARLADSPEAIARILPIVQGFAEARSTKAIAHYDYALVLSKSVRGSPNAQAEERIKSELLAAIAEESQFAAAHFQLAIAYENAGEMESAIAQFSQAVSLNPDMAEWRYRLARAYRRAGHDASAELEIGKFKQIKSLRDAGGDVSAKLLEGLPPDLLGVAGARCEPRSSVPSP
jgi:tetratricopeptide (TPR) repeat protein